MLQKEWAWQRHSAIHNFVNPTWPTEWRQFMPLMAYADYMQTGDTSLFEDYYPLLFSGSQATCINKKNKNLVDFSQANGNCKRSCEVDFPAKNCRFLPILPILHILPILPS
jgi:hypothetical protein